MRTITKRFFRLLTPRNLDTKKNYIIERQLQNFFRQHILRPADRIFNETLKAPGRDIPLRIFLPVHFQTPTPVLIFFHGGGWVTGSLDSYNKFCTQLAEKTDHVVISVDYRLAPEHTFPAGLEDCYYASQYFFINAKHYGIQPGEITLIGDSAGGNIAAVVSLMARDRKKHVPRKQILIYPATDSLPASGPSPYPSMEENGDDFILTRQRIDAYMDLYRNSEEDRNNPYLAPIRAESLERQPDTLVITAEFDPLRDEGAAYAQRLASEGNFVVYHVAKDALHGYLTSGIFHKQTEETFGWMNAFLRGTL